MIRTVALAIDGMILFGVAYAADVILAIVFGRTSTAYDIIGWAVVTGLPIAYFGGLWLLREATVGQSLFGLRVVRAADGRPISLGQSLVRVFGLILSGLVWWASAIAVGIGHAKRSPADVLARTLVVRKAR
jgi:uncharacterized RDD family membrane protein YckC